jgi:hypothetical protein
MKPKLRPLLLALVTLVALAGFALLLFTAGKPAPLPPLPIPNGYDDLIKAGALVGNGIGDASTMKTDDLRELISTNQEALRLFRLGLSQKCQVPIQAAWINVLMAATNGGNHLIDLTSLKRLAQLLNAEGRLAEMEHRPADAARTYIELMRFGNEISRGGFLVHRLVGIACEAIGYVGLVKVVPQLNCEESRPLLAELEKVDNQAVTWNKVMQSEKEFVRRELRQTFNPINQIVGRWQNWQMLKKAEAKHNFTVARRRLLMTELALRCYQSEHGRGPERLDQLAPKYLQQIPTDPFSEQTLIYRAQGTNWLLYSVGPDGVDEGGKRTGKIVFGSGNTGDLFFDAPL